MSYSSDHTNTEYDELLKDKRHLVEMLEEVLSITETFKEQLTPEERNKYLAISATTADYREDLE